MGKHSDRDVQGTAWLGLLIPRRTAKGHERATQREVVQCLRSRSVCWYLFARVSPLEADAGVELSPHCAVQHQLLSH